MQRSLRAPVQRPFRRHLTFHAEPSSAAGAHAITKILAIVHILVGLACSAVAIPFIGLFLTDPTADPTYRAAGGFFIPLFIVYFAPSVIAGVGLLFNARWARLTLIAQAVAYLILIPLGTALGAATLIILLARQAGAVAKPTQAAKSSPVQAAGPSFWNRPLGRIPGALTVGAIVGSGYVVAIDVLWHLNEKHTPAALDQGAIVALPLMLFAMFLLVRSIRMHDGGNPDWHSIDLFGSNSRRWRRESRLLNEEEHRRIKRLSADPALRKYADLIRNGQHWSDDQIAYDRDPSRLVTCAHVQPIERAMREAGILVRPLYGVLVSAACVVDGPRLQSQFSIALPVWFSDDIPGDRPYDPEGAAIMCREHGSGIWLLHPRDAKPDTPIFPAAER